MVEENELLVLFTAISAFIFFLLNFEKLKSLPYFHLFIISYVALLLGWTFTVIESLFLEVLMNLFEHICYLTFGILLVIWLILVYHSRREKNK